MKCWINHRRIERTTVDFPELPNSHNYCRESVRERTGCDFYHAAGKTSGTFCRDRIPIQSIADPTQDDYTRKVGTEHLEVCEPERSPSNTMLNVSNGNGFLRSASSTFT